MNFGLGILVSVLTILLEPPGVATQDPDISPAVEKQLRSFLDRHDKLLCEGKFDELKDFYSPDFMSTDLYVGNREQMLAQWERLWSQYRDISLQTMIMRIDRAAGNHYAISACRPFRAVDRKGREQVQDDFCETMIVRIDDGVPRFVQLFEMDHGKIHRLQPPRRFVSETLSFSLSYPDGLLVIPHRTPGTQLEKLVFVDPERDLRIDVSLMDPTLPLDLGEAIRRDLKDDERCEWVEEPTPARFGPLRAMTAELEFCPYRFRGELDQSFRTRAVYLSPDGRMLFAMVMKAPTNAFPDCRETLQQLASGLQVDGEPSACAVYTQRLFDGHPKWSTVDAGFYEHPVAPLSMEVPEGLNPVMLAGYPMQRLRLDLIDDPGSYMLLQVYEPEWMDDAAEKRMHKAAERLLETVCSPTDRKVSSDLHAREFLDQHAKSLAVSFHCPDRDATFTHRILSTDRDGFYVQLLLVAGSDNVARQQELFERTAGALVWD